MEKNKRATSSQRVESRNRNKNKNKTLQNKVKERELAKKEKARRLAEEVEKAVEEVKVEEETVRDNIVVVPDRRENVLEEFESNENKKENDGFKTIVIPIADINEALENEKDEDDFIEVKINKFRFVCDEDDKENDSNKIDKFEFVIADEEKQEKINDDLEEFYENSKEDVLDEVYEEVIPVKVETIDNKNDEIIPRTTDNVDINAKKHISFEKRVIGLLVIIIVTFFIAGLLIFKAVTHSEQDAVTYDEKSSIEYNVCINENTYSQYYNSSCLEENMEYLTSISERIPTSFRYEIDYSESVDKTLDYYVVSKVVISKELNGKVLNTVEDVLVDRTSYSVFGSEAEFLVDVDVPVSKYVEYVNNYNTQFGLTSYATLEVVFYVDNGNAIKKAGTLSMPISTPTFNVDRIVIDNKNQNLNVVNNSWGSMNTSYAVVGLIFVLFGLLAIIRLADLVYKVMGTTSLYQRKLNKILREHDRVIVIARGEYNVDSSKKLIKVASFGELLDARDTLEKPIVYLKVNSVKSEFYVEDSEAIYKYTMKEADFGGK